MLFGDKLRMLREEKSLTQKDLGEIIGVSDRVVGYYEVNDRFPKEENILKKIAQYFNVSLDFLLGLTDIRKPYDGESIVMPDYDNAEDALKFILSQPALMSYGGYDLNKMSEEEIIELANDLLLALRISIERRKKK